MTGGGCAAPRSAHPGAQRLPGSTASLGPGALRAPLMTVKKHLTSPRASPPHHARLTKERTTTAAATCLWESAAEVGFGEKISWMQPSEIQRALAAAMLTASALDLIVYDAIVLHDSNRLAVRLLPCEVLARVAPTRHQAAQFEVELAQRLAETESPVAALEPRVEPRVYERDGFVVTLWTYYKPVASREVSPADYANALERLHAGMRKLDVRTPHFTDRVEAAQQLVESRNLTPQLADADRELLINTLRSRRQAIIDRGAAEQLLHGEPHPGNMLSTKTGLLFIDLETCCRGPVEFDLAHVPEDVSERYADADEELLSECRILVLAMVAAWRWDPGDQLPNGEQAARELLSALREGPGGGGGGGVRGGEGRKGKKKGGGEREGKRSVVGVDSIWSSLNLGRK